MNTPQAPPSTITRPAATTRRSMLRAAAWAVPAVTVATATPAYATSTTHSFSGLTWGLAEWNILAVPTRLDVTGLRVTTASGSATIPARGLTVTVTFPERYVRALGANLNVLVYDVSPGWVAAAPQYGGSGDSRYATVTFTHLDEVRPGFLTGGSRLLNFKARRDSVTQPSTYDVPLPVVVNASNFTPAPGIIAVT